MLLLSVFTSCHWHKGPFLPELPRTQLAPGPPSPPACPAWTAHQTSLSPSPSHPRCSPGDRQKQTSNKRGSVCKRTNTNSRFLSLKGGSSCEAFCSSVTKSTYLPVPQVAHLVGLQQENIVGVERRGPRQHFNGLGVQLISPSHLEEPGTSVRVDHTRSAGTTLKTHACRDFTHTQICKIFSTQFSFFLVSNYDTDTFPLRNKTLQ